jgi:hypothetical protein
MRLWSFLLLTASLAQAESRAQKALNLNLGKTQGNIQADWPNGKMFENPAHQPVWIWETKGVFISVPGRPPSQTSTTYTQVNQGNVVVLPIGNGAIIQSSPGTATSTTTVQTDPGVAPSSYYLHWQYRFFLDSTGRVSRWEQWYYSTHGPELTQSEMGHLAEAFKMEDTWELQTDKKGKQKPVRVFKKH